MTSPAIAPMLYVFFRMAIDAPGHSQRSNPRDAVHGLDGSVAFLTFDVCFYVPLMCEVNEIGDIVHLDPWYRFTLFPVGVQLEDFRLLAHVGQGFMATHALADAGDAGDRCRVRIDVAVLARNLIVRCMHLVTEFDWLDRAAIRKIFAVHPCADQQSEHCHKPEQGWLPRGPKRIENGDRQIVPPSYGARVCP